MQALTAVLSLIAGILTTLLTVFYAPAWKNKMDGYHERRDRSARIISQYGEPLARAAFDLQTNLYAVMRHQALDGSPRTKELAGKGLLWLFGQYLAWVEIFRREVQLLDLGQIETTAALQQHLYDVTDVLASARLDPRFQLTRSEQRAVGEIMVVERQVFGNSRSDALGYAEFCRRLGDAEFARWFSALTDGITSIRSDGIDGATRVIYLQRQLVSLMEFLDPDYIRFPDANERGVLPVPLGMDSEVLPKQERKPSRIARFRYLEGDPWRIFAQWVADSGMSSTGIPAEGGSTRVQAANSRCRVDMHFEQNWVELHAWSYSALLRRQRGASLLSKSARGTIDDLLVRFDRPRLRR